MKTGSKAVALFCLLIGAVLSTYLVSLFSWRVDLTDAGFYGLSPGTKSLLRKIDEPVTLRFYFTRGIEGLPVSLKNYALRVEEMLRQYAAAADGRIRLEVIDPRPDTPEEQQAVRANLDRQALPNGETLIFGLVGFQTGEKTIPFFPPERELHLEYELSRLIHGVQQLSRPKLYLLSSLPLRGADPSLHGRLQTPRQLIADEWEHQFEIVQLFPDSLDIPGRPDLIVLVHPQQLSDPLLYELDQYLLRGGTLFIAVDPSSRFFRSQAAQAGMPLDFSSGLDRLFRAWGVDYDRNRIVTDPALATRVTSLEGEVLLPTWLGIAPEQLDRSFLPLAGARSLMLPEAGAFAVRPNDDFVVNPLIQSSGRASSLSADELGFDRPEEIARGGAPEGVKQIAVRLHGRFPTAFPEGKPKEIAMFTDHPPVLTASEKPGTVFLIADTDWLMDGFGTRPAAQGAGALELVNDNLPVAAGVAEYLSGSADLIAIREKRPAARPFEVVQRMEREASARHQAKLQEIEQKLETVQQRLAEHEARQKEAAALVPPPEVLVELERFRADETRLQAERREIRKALREDIERLETNVLLLNLLVVPAGVAVWGTAVFTRRQRRRRTARGTVALAPLVGESGVTPPYQRTLIVGVLGLAVLALTTTFLKRTRGPGGSGDERVEQPLVPSALLAEATKVRITHEGRTATIIASGNRQWRVEEYRGLPADMGKLAHFFEALNEIKVNRLVTSRPEKIAQFGFAGDKLEVFGASGALLRSIEFGHIDERQDRFIRFGEETKVYHAPIYYWLDGAPKNWVRTRFYDLEIPDVVALEIPLPNGDTPLRLTRNTEGGWTADPATLPAGKQVRPNAVASLAEELTELRFREAHPLDAASALAAAPHRQELSFSVRDGTTYHISYGRPPMTAEAIEQDLDPPPAFLTIASSRPDDPVNALSRAWALEIKESIYDGLARNRAALLQDAP